MSRSVKCLSYKQENLSSVRQHSLDKKLGVTIVCTGNPGAEEGETGGSLELSDKLV